MQNARKMSPSFHWDRLQRRILHSMAKNDFEKYLRLLHATTFNENKQSSTSRRKSFFVVVVVFLPLSRFDQILLWKRISR